MDAPQASVDCRPKRNKAERQRDRAEIANKLLDGWSHQQIADWLAQNRPYQISRVMVTKEVHRVMDDWHHEAVEAIEKHKARELARLRQRERQAMEGYERSRQERIITQVKQGKDGKSIASGMITKENRDGNPSFLTTALQCIQLRCAILGIKAPTQAEITGLDGAPIAVQIEQDKPIPPEHLEMTVLRALQEKHGTAPAADPPPPVAPESK